MEERAFCYELPTSCRLGHDVDEDAEENRDGFERMTWAHPGYWRNAMHLGVC